MKRIQRGTVARCSLGRLGVITVDSPVEVTYSDGSTGTSWVGIYIEDAGDSKIGDPWASRTPRPVEIGRSER